MVYAQAPALNPTPADQRTVQIVATLLERSHFSKPTINDEISRKWCRNYIKILDPRKYYFVKADIDEFLKSENDLDDTIATGNLDFEKKVFDRFLVRSDERLANALEVLDQKPDFALEESLVDDPERIDYPADAAEARDRLRKYIKLELLSAKIGKIDDAEARKNLVIRYRDLNRTNAQLDSVEVLERYLTALTTVIDPHSNYMGPKELEDMLNQRIRLTLDGIGASLLSIDGYPVVQDVVAGGAADKDGRLQPEDKIVGVVLPDGTRESFVEKKLQDSVRKIRGPRGTKVSIVVVPADTKEEKVYELTRQRIDLADEKAKGQVVEFKVAGSDTPKKYGILHVPSFYGNSDGVLNGDPDAASVTRDCRNLLQGFKQQGVDAVVVDLRGNPGGLLDEAVSLSGLFIDKGPVVQVRETQSVTHQDDEEEGTAWDGPMAVIIDHYCASASEILAGVIKDYGPGPDRRRLLDLWQGDRPERDRLQPAPRGVWHQRQVRRPEAHDPPVLPAQRREHPDPRRHAQHPHPLLRRRVRLRRGSVRHLDPVRQGGPAAAHPVQPRADGPGGQDRRAFDRPSPGQPQVPGGGEVPGPRRGAQKAPRNLPERGEVSL